MYNIPQDYAARFAPGARTLLKLTHGQTVYNLASVRLTSPISAGGLTIGAVSAASVEAKVQAVVDLAGERVAITAETPDGAYSLPIGTFVVSEAKAGEQLTTITAYDAVFWALGGAYIPSASSPPTTALGVLTDLCGQCLLTLGSTSGLTDVSISGDLTGHICREMAGYMAALLGCNVVVDRAGALCLRRFADHGQTVTPDVYYAGALNLAAPSTLAGVRMRKVVTTISTDSDGIQHETTDTATYEAGSGSGVVIEVDNPYATQAIVDAVWTALHGALTTFRAGSCAYFGGMTVEPGDLLTITDTDNQSCVFPVLSAVLELDGGCKATVSASRETETALAGVRGPVGRLLSKIQADLGAFKELTAENFTATKAKVDNLYADSAWVNSLFAQTIDANHLNIGGNSKIGMFEFQGYGDQRPFALVLPTEFKNAQGDVYMARIVQLTANGLDLSSDHYTTGTQDYWAISNGNGFYARRRSSDGDFNSYAELSPSMGQQALVLELREHPGQPNEVVKNTYITAEDAQFGGDVSVSGNLTVTGDISAANLPVMQWGNTGNIANLTTTAQYISVTFPTAFAGTPLVLLTPRQNGGYFANCKIHTVSSTGFTLGINCTGGTVSTMSVNWLAIYQP